MTQLIQSNQEQSDTTKNVDNDSFVCMVIVPKTEKSDWTWKVVMVVDDQDEADDWWEAEPKSARVYYGTGKIRNAK